MSFISAPSFNQYAQASGTWAARPTSAPVLSRYFATDIGPNGTLFAWDGTYWRPANGFAVVYGQYGTIAAPIATLTGNGTQQVFTLPELCLLPAGLLAPGSRLDVEAQVYKEGVHTGSALGFLSSVPAPVNMSLDDFQNSSSTATNPSTIKLVGNLLIGSGIWVESQVTQVWNAGNSTAVQIDHADANVNSENRYIGAGIGTSYTSDLARLLSLRVSISAG